MSEDKRTIHLEFTVIHGTQVFLDWMTIQSLLTVEGRKFYANDLKENLCVLNESLKMNGLHPHNDVKPENTGAAVRIGPDGQLLEIQYVYHFDISTLVEFDREEYDDMRSGPYYLMEYSDCVDLVCHIIDNNLIDWSLTEEERGEQIRMIKEKCYPKYQTR